MSNPTWNLTPAQALNPTLIPTLTLFPNHNPNPNPYPSPNLNPYPISDLNLSCNPDPYLNPNQPWGSFVMFHLLFFFCLFGVVVLENESLTLIFWW